MTKETTKREEDIDPEAIARWDNDGGAPGSLKRGASCLRPTMPWSSECILVGVPVINELRIATRAFEFKQRHAAVVQRGTEAGWPVAIEADERAGGRRQQLEDGTVTLPSIPVRTS